jgi:HEAT repeat protein
MFRRIWNALFRRKPESSIIVRSDDVVVISGNQSATTRLAVDAEVSGDQPGTTGLEDASSQELMDVCDAYWKQLAEPSTGSLADAFTPEAAARYDSYVNAINELSTRGPEILTWATSRLAHPEYDAREQAAFLVGQLGARNQLGDQLETTIDQLSELATRSVVEDGKETQANTAAVMALGKIQHTNGLSALRLILTSPEWRDDELPWDAADAVGKIVNESFMDGDDPVTAAREWLKAHPNA